MTQPSRDRLTGVLRAYYDATPAYHHSPASSEVRPPAWDPNQRVLDEHVRQGDRLLDLAGGAGHLRSRLPPCRYIVADLSREALRQGTGGVVADARRLPFADERFDVVLCHHGLEHFPEPAASLAEATRVLRAGGALILCGPSFDSPRQPLPMLAHRGRLIRLELRLRLALRLVANEIRHALGRFAYRPIVLEDVASLHGVGPAQGDYDAVHPTQTHETAFYLEQLGLRLDHHSLWGDHRHQGPSLLQRCLSRIPVVRWMVWTFPLVARKLALADARDPAMPPRAPAASSISSSASV